MRAPAQAVYAPCSELRAASDFADAVGDCSTSPPHRLTGLAVARRVCTGARTRARAERCSCLSPPARFAPRPSQICESENAGSGGRGDARRPSFAQVCRTLALYEGTVLPFAESKPPLRRRVYENRRPNRSDNKRVADSRPTSPSTRRALQAVILDAQDVGSMLVSIVSRTAPPPNHRLLACGTEAQFLPPSASAKTADPQCTQRRVSA